MSLIISINGTDLDLLTIDAHKLDELNTLDEDVLFKLAHEIICKFNDVEIQQLVTHLANVCMSQASYQVSGLRGLLGRILMDYVAQHDGERAFIQLFRTKDNLDFINTFEFSEESRRLFTCLHKIATKRSTSTRDNYYLDALPSNLFEDVFEPMMLSIGKVKRSPSMYYVAYTLNQLRLNKVQIGVFFNRSILQESLATLEGSALQHTRDIRQQTKEIIHSVNGFTSDPETDTLQLTQAVHSTEQVLKGKMPITVYTKEARALTNTHLKDLGLLMLALASSLALLSISIVATGGSNLIAGAVVLGSLCAADYAYSFFNNRVFDTPSGTNDAELTGQDEGILVNQL